MNLFDSIRTPEDIKKLNINELQNVAEEIRSFLIENVSKTGGHLASNLGVVELTIALHKNFSTPFDRIVWDVGHQSYVHKIITGRKDEFPSLRQMNGIAGFPKTSECCHDCFNTGHSSTSISAALGMAKARDLKKEDYSVIAVIGDGALTGGMAFEALNDAGRSPTDIIVILNDNEMSITHNVGGLSRYLSRIRTEPFYYKVKEDIDIILNKIPAIGKSAIKALDMAKGTIKYLITPGIIFEEIGFTYLGPVDGHDLSHLNTVLSRAKNIKGPIFIHVLTRKGKGYSFAEETPHAYHGISPFEVETGEVMKQKSMDYSAVFGQELISLAREDSKVVAITAAMPHGTGLDKFSNLYRDRFFDVGIAEQHAVTFAAGMAANGLKPVVAVYSTFLQRAYDQILHDVALQNLHVVFCIDRAGIVGEDGETHQGIYDISYLRPMPNMVILAPSDYDEFSAMLRYALLEHKGPIAIRYPRGNAEKNITGHRRLVYGRGETITSGTDVSIIAAGNMVETAVEAAGKLRKRGFAPEVINARFIKPLDEELIVGSAIKTGKIVTLEDNVKAAGFGSSIVELLKEKGLEIPARTLGYPDSTILHGSKKDLYKYYGLDAESVAKTIEGFIKKNPGSDIQFG